MARSLLIFGNGLGMALNSDYFRLACGLNAAWNATNTFTPEHKRLVASAIPGVSDEQYPESEEQLDRLQMALVASNFLRAFETKDVRWLTDTSRELPTAFRRFVHAVAVYFHESGLHLPLAFMEPLADYIGKTRSHIAVLNYDNLLYDGLKSFNLLRGYQGALIDGFWRSTGFQTSNLERHAGRDSLGWYLHLHGSPLFVGNDKMMGTARDFLDPTAESHIVLTHVHHKPSIIDSSHILSEYWRRLNQALDEAEHVILFGYSGEDLHLNEKIISAATGKRVFIVEWAGTGDRAARYHYWATRLKGMRLELNALGNILDFTEWSELGN